MQDLAADGPAPAPSADHRHRAGLQQVVQARDIGAAPAARDSIQVAVELRIVVGGQRHAQLHHAVGVPPLDGQPGGGEDALHRQVLRQGLGRERGQVPLPGE